MSLPIYQHIVLKSTQLDDLEQMLSAEMNQKRPVAINLTSLDLEQQREMVGLIENFFVSHNLSFRFPYPVYLISAHESALTEMPIVASPQGLPSFFTQKDTKINVKEAQVLGKNKLLQQEVRNADALASENGINQFGEIHKKIYIAECERQFYRSLLNRLIKSQTNG